MKLVRTGLDGKPLKENEIGAVISVKEIDATVVELVKALNNSSLEADPTTMVALLLYGAESLRHLGAHPDVIKKLVEQHLEQYAHLPAGQPEGGIVSTLDAMALLPTDNKVH